MCHCHKGDKQLEGYPLTPDNCRWGGAQSADKPGLIKTLTPSWISICIRLCFATFWAPSFLFTNYNLICLFRAGENFSLCPSCLSFDFSICISRGEVVEQIFMQIWKALEHSCGVACIKSISGHLRLHLSQDKWPAAIINKFISGRHKRLLITRSLATLFDPEKVDGCKLFAFTGGSVSLQGQRAFGIKVGK